MRTVPHELPADVRLWWVDLDAYADTVPCAGLEEAEYERAERMVLKEGARRFLASRHALRSLLAETLGCSLGQIHIALDEYGKPYLADGGAHFNLSHSGPEGLIGISRGAAIGVDVEVVKPVPEADALAREHFSEAEHTEWQRAPGTDRDRGFLCCWTRKEACVKALGHGLALALASFDVGCAGGVRVVSVALDTWRGEVTVCSVQPPGAAAAAVALRRPEAAVLTGQARGPL